MKGIEKSATFAKAHDPTYQAYQILHLGYTVLPIIAGADKFTNFLAKWEAYLAPIVPQLTGLSPTIIMTVVGVIEILAGVIIFLRPKIGGYIVGFWLLGIVANLLLAGYFDIALRDFGLALGAFALARLSANYE